METRERVERKKKGREREGRRAIKWEKKGNTMDREREK